MEVIIKKNNNSTINLKDVCGLENIYIEYEDYIILNKSEYNYMYKKSDIKYIKIKF